MMARALVAFYARLAAGAVTALWTAVADIGEVLFTRWLCDGAAVALACAMARIAAWAWQAAQRGGRGAVGAEPGATRAPAACAVLAQRRIARPRPASVAGTPSAATSQPNAGQDRPCPGAGTSQGARVA